VIKLGTKEYEGNSIMTESGNVACGVDFWMCALEAWLVHDGWKRYSNRSSFEV